MALFFYSFYSTDTDLIYLENPSFFESRRGKIKLGKSVKYEKSKYNFYLSMKDLEKHMFICGATGTGKSNFVQNFLLNFAKKYDISFLLVEFKGEYHFLQRIIDNLVIIRPGENFSINIFNPEGTIPEVHAERIFDILKSGHFLDENAEFSPQMEKVLVEMLTIVCNNENLQSWNGFYECCELYSRRYDKQIPMLSQTLISIKNRIRRFSLGSLKAIFDTRNELKVNELLERNVLIDLSSIIRLGGEKSDALFFLNMILKYLWDKNITRGAYNFKGIKHITIVEDAQYFVPKELTRQTKLTTYLEDIALLQRGTGECLISIATHPDISAEILANCGALIVFKTHMQREFLCELLNLEKEKEYFLSILEEGQCIARVNSIKRPFLLSIPYIERSSVNLSEINVNNEFILNKKENQVEKKLKNEKKSLLKALKLKKEILENSKSVLSKIFKKIKRVVFQIKKKKEKNNEDITNPIKGLQSEAHEKQGYISNINHENEEIIYEDLDEDTRELVKYIDELIIKEKNKDQI